MPRKQTEEMRDGGGRHATTPPITLLVSEDRELLFNLLHCRSQSSVWCAEDSQQATRRLNSPRAVVSHSFCCYVNSQQAPPHLHMVTYAVVAWRSIGGSSKQRGISNCRDSSTPLSSIHGFLSKMFDTISKEWEWMPSSLQTVPVQAHMLVNPFLGSTTVKKNLPVENALGSQLTDFHNHHI